MSDNAPQYTSQEFLNFAKTYGFKLITRSPYYARATGKAEAAVKEAKKMLKKSDLLTGLRDHRNTPPQGMTYSPAQRFLCRRTKCNLPISESLLSQSVQPVTVMSILVGELKLKLIMTKLLAETYPLSRLDNLCTPGLMTITVVNGGGPAKSWAK